MKRAFLFPLASLMLATPAAAQEFAGFRIEGRLGYDSTTLDKEYEDALTSAQSNNNEDGLVFGGEAGYDFAVGPAVTVGGYVGVDFSDADFCAPVLRLEKACLELRRNIYFGARGGYQVASSTLVYAKAGYSNGQARATFEDVENVLDDLNDSGSRDGWHFGAGVEQNFGSGIYGRLEYVRTVYSDLDFENEDYTVTVDSHRSQVVAGLGVRF